ncbi:hypothetical protein ABT120_40625 [Nonomuraea angiospora]|uniref:hypothetical protein n=1 Tax=Nonomuraea angiospora TaxID=46172 RepID=UPI0033182E03
MAADRLSGDAGGHRTGGSATGGQAEGAAERAERFRQVAESLRGGVEIADEMAEKASVTGSPPKTIFSITRSPQC